MSRKLATLLGVAALSLSAAGANAADAKLAGILDAQSDAAKARYQYRHPQETLEFFGIEPGMTVVEALPGEVWYTGILLPYLGSSGKVIGADYAVDTWKGVGYDSAEFLATREDWPAKWTAKTKESAPAGSAGLDAFVFGSLPESMHGTADMVLFFRAIHNMNYTAPNAAHLKAGIQDAWNILKTGGIVGIVQHEARENMSDAWSDGDNGYLKKSYVVDLMEEAGFRLEAESDINENDMDKPTESDFVWRLPPSLSGTDDDPERAAAMSAIGESNRMTLKFVKP